MVKLIVDSPSCIDKSYAEQHNISVVNLNVELDGETRKEDFINTWGDFYTKLENSENFPKTSLPSPDDFLSEYNKVFSADPNADIVVVTISKSLSGTVNSARVARDMSDKANQIFVIDSGACAQSELLLIEEIVELINQQKTGAQIAEIAEVIKEQLSIDFVPSTVEYLKRGGRMSLLTATIANVLSIKPILHFCNGVLTNTKKCLGMGKALVELVKSIPDKFKKIYVIYIHESEFLAPLIKKVNERFGLNIIEAKNIGPVVGSHIGIGAVGIACLRNY